MLNPYLLLFLPLIAVPILLHLITLRRLQTVELSTFRFLMDSYAQQRRKLRLLEYLVPLLRALFVALIILTLSRPEVTGLTRYLGTPGGRDLAVVLDCGAGMAATHAGTSSFQRAKAAAQVLLRALSGQDHLTLIAAGAQPLTLYRGYAGDAPQLLAALERAELSAAAADLPAALTQVLEAPRHGPRSVYLLSDLRRSAWSSFERHPVRQLLDQAGKLVVMDLGPSDPSATANLALVGQPPSSLGAVVGLPLTMQVTLQNFSPSGSEPAQASVRLILDEEQAAHVDLTAPVGQPLTHTLTFTPHRPGLLRGRFELLRSATLSDALPLDDAFLFCLNVEPCLRVLLVESPQAAADPGDTPGLYVSTALRAPVTMGLVAPELRSLSAALQVTRLSVDRLTDAALAAADVAVLCDAPLTAEQAQTLRQQVERGCGLLVLPGPDLDVAAYNDVLLAHAAGEPRYLAPVGDPDDATTFVPVTLTRVAHPILRAFDEAGQSFFSTTRLYRRLPIRWNTADPTQALLATPDHSPALLEAALGRGRVMLACFSAAPRYANVALKPEFVPLLLRSVAHLRRRAAWSVTAAADPGQPAVVSLPEAWSAAQVTVTDPAGKPSRIELHRQERSFVGAVLDTQRRGFYELEIATGATGNPDPGGQAPGAPDRIAALLAVNLQAQESDLRRIDDAAVLRSLGGDSGLAPLLLRATADDPTLQRQLTEKREVWRTLIWLTFAVIAAEFLLSTLRPGRGATPAAANEPPRRLARLFSLSRPNLRKSA